MKLEDIVVLLPVDSLEELSLDQEPLAAQSLLAAWTAPFHPAILASAGRVVRWQSIEHFLDSEPTASSLVLLPSLGGAALPDGWIERAEAAGALVVRDLVDRDAAVAQVLAWIDRSPNPIASDRLDADLVADFHALGLAQLLVELQMRQHYAMAGVDRDVFGDHALRAAEAALGGDEPAARESLQSAFDLLIEGREYFHSLESLLLDFTLVAPLAAGDALIDELAGEIPKTLLLSGRTAATLALDEPESLAAMKTALAAGRANLVGGEFAEPALPLAAPEAILAGIRRGLAAYEEHLGARPVVFGRRSFGLTPILPQLLDQCGFVGACRFTLGGGRFPSDHQSKIRWEGAGDAAIDALARVPIDAGRADGFLRLPERLTGVMELDDVPTVVFAHWPGRPSFWYDAARRMSGYGPVLGRFVGVNAWFEETAGSGRTVRHDPDEYHSPYLAESVERGEPDPISRWVRHHARQAALDAVGALRLMAAAAQGDLPAPVDVDDLRLAADDLANDAALASASAESRLDERIQAALAETLGAAAKALSRAGDKTTLGQLIVNPWSFRRAADAPAMGFAWRAPDAAASESVPAESSRREPFWRRKPRRRSPEEEYVLRNEFFEAAIDPATGALRAIHDGRTRGNRLAARLALRAADLAAQADAADGPEDEEAAYSIMAADHLEIETSPGGGGRIASRGRLVDRRGNQLAEFRQTFRARRGSRVLELDVELMPEREPDANPWHSYYAVRFAWDDPAAELRRSVNLMSWPTEASRFESPHFVEIRGDRRRTAILAGGLPYHRRRGARKLDCLLIVRGETARRFRVGIGVDVPHPAAAAIDFLAPQTLAVDSARRPPSDSGWLFHVDTPNVIATGWEPIGCEGRTAGFRARLLETEGHATSLRLRSFRRPTAARHTDFLGNPRQDLPIEDDHVTIRLEPYQWTQIDVEW